ncbi:MAG: hypothetical protein AB7N73_14985 [Gemmatimonadales bacterium]
MAYLEDVGAHAAELAGTLALTEAELEESSGLYRGLGATFAPVRAVQVNARPADILSDPRFRLLAANKAVQRVLEKASPPPAPPPEPAPVPVATHPGGLVPPPVTPAAPEPGPGFAPTWPEGPMYTTLPAPVQPAAGAPVNVSVTAPAGEVPEGGRGFGLVEAAIAAGLAALLGAAFSRKRRR